MKFSDFDLSKNSDGLLPVVVQDSATLKVLMVAYMNEEVLSRLWLQVRQHSIAAAVRLCGKRVRQAAIL